MLTSLHLHNFRNYESLDLQVEPGLNLLIGGNGQGKTNLLEAIQFLSLLRSFRTTRITDLHRWGTRLFRLRAKLISGERDRQLALEYGQQRRLMLDRQQIHRASDFIRHVYCNTFVPEDIGLVKGTGNDRRRFIDMLATQLYPGYLTQLQDYAKALKARNILLRREKPDAASIRAYDQVLIERGTNLMLYRREMIGDLEKGLAAVAVQLFPADRQLCVEYQPSVKEAEQEDAAREQVAASFREELHGAWERDCSRQHTTRGPHRDDLRLMLDSRLLSHFGSEGQCRLAVLALKMSAGELLLEDKREQAVIWLVDDVVGELDGRARKAFYAHLERADQTFLVATGPEVLQELAPAAVYDVEQATITRRTD